MSYQSTIKSLLDLKIEERINSIQRRISLNLESYKPVHTTQKEAQAALLSTAEDDTFANKAGIAIQDCNQTLNKLFYLKSALSEISEEDGVFYLDNYHLFSFDGFCNHICEKSVRFLK